MANSSINRSVRAGSSIVQPADMGDCPERSGHSARSDFAGYKRYATLVGALPGKYGYSEIRLDHMVDEHGDTVRIAPPKLGTLANCVNHADTIAPWSYGICALMKSLAAWTS